MVYIYIYYNIMYCVLKVPLNNWDLSCCQEFCRNDEYIYICIYIYIVLYKHLGYPGPTRQGNSDVEFRDDK